MQVDSQFERILSEFPVDAVNCAEETIYGLTPDLKISYVNKGWMRFASDNGGGLVPSLKSPIGNQFLDAIPTLLRPFFKDNFTKCLQEKRPWEHHYECSSDQSYRRFLMMTYPLRNGEGLLVVNSLEHEGAHKRSPHKPIEELYCDSDGLICQCCHCRRVRRTGTSGAWDWMPDWVINFPPNMSHGICKPCFGFYYPKVPHAEKGFPKKFMTCE